MNDSEAIAWVRSGGRVRRPQWTPGPYLFLRNGHVWSRTSNGLEHNLFLPPEEYFDAGAEWEAIVDPSQYNPIRKIVRKLEL